MKDRVRALSRLKRRRRSDNFADTGGERRIVQQSFERARALTPIDRIYVVTNAAFTALVREQLPELPAENVVGEPERKDTAAAAVLATLLAEKKFANSVVAILTSDQLIAPLDSFTACTRSAIESATTDDALFTIGIRPSFPATGYGYLELGAREGAGEQYAVQRYVEKPDLKRAQEYVASGKFLWNSGSHRRLLNDEEDRRRRLRAAGIHHRTLTFVVVGER